MMHLDMRAKNKQTKTQNCRGREGNIGMLFKIIFFKMKDSMQILFFLKFFLLILRSISGPTLLCILFA